MPLQAFRELSDRTRTGDRLDHNQNQAGTRGHFRPVCAANDGDRVAGTGRALRLECSEIVLSDAGFVNQFVEIPALYRESVAAEGGCAGALRWSSCAEVGSDRRPDVSSVASVSRRGTARGRVISLVWSDPRGGRPMNRDRTRRQPTAPTTGPSRRCDVEPSHPPQLSLFTRKEARGQRTPTLLLFVSMKKGHLSSMKERAVSSGGH